MNKGLIGKIFEFTDIFTLAVAYDVSRVFRKCAKEELRVCKSEEWLLLLRKNKLSTSFTYEFKEQIFAVGLEALQYQVYSETFLLYFAYYAYENPDTHFISAMWKIINSRYNVKKFSTYSKNYINSLGVSI